MASKSKKEKPADPKEGLKAQIDARKQVFAKHKGKALNDDKRRLALKKLKRAQRSLGKVVNMEKKLAAAKAKAEATES